MATASTGRVALAERLVTAGWEFDFFQAVWLLERYREMEVRVGDRGPVERESLRFRPDLSIGFPATDVRRIDLFTDALTGASRYQIEVTFMGLYGVSTPLPLHYAVDVLRSSDQAGPAPSESEEPASTRERAGSEPAARPTPLRDFLDIFHHRLVSLFYRSWLKYRYDRTFGLPGRDVITDYLLWMIGCPRGYDASTLGVSPIRLLRYAGVLTQRPRSAPTLEGMLTDYWKTLPVDIQQCVGRWVSVSESDRNRLGLANATLDTDLTVGAEVYDLNGAFNVTLGPMDWATYLTFLPGEQGFNETCAIVQLYCYDPMSFTIELCLASGEVPVMQLSSDAQAGRLGLTSWVRTDEIPSTSVTFQTSTLPAWQAERSQGSHAGDAGATDTGSRQRESTTAVS